MKIYVNVKQLGKRKNVIEPVPYELDSAPSTLRELIGALVMAEVEKYNLRVRCPADSDKPSAIPSAPLTSDEMNGMSEVGRIAFGLSYSEKRADEKKSIDAAILAFSDGIYRVFKAETECTELDAPLTVADGDSFTFIRLVMLAGRML
ncbi:MAG: hypothetical protein IJY04_10775 [Clostridia bacterium]|nr:hypothetical protein [Clostridia bacterium]